jgi:hypothetical protein
MLYQAEPRPDVFMLVMDLCVQVKPSHPVVTSSGLAHPPRCETPGGFEMLLEKRLKSSGHRHASAIEYTHDRLPV